MPSASTSPAAAPPSTSVDGVTSVNAPVRRARILVAAAAAAALMMLVGVTSAWAAVTPSFYTTASPNTTVGLQIFDHANLMSSATGTITFRLYAPGDTACQTPIFTSTVAVSGTGSDNSATYNTAAAGTYQWVASYNGDANDNPISSSCGTASQSVIVGKVGTVATTTTAYNGTGAIQGTTSLRGGFAPLGGTITFTVTGPNDTWCAGTPVFTRTVPVNGAGSYDSGWFVPTAPGTYTYRIRYTGDANSNGFGPSNCIDQNAAITLTASQLAAGGTWTNPTDGGVKDTTTPFTWMAAPGAQEYLIWIGTAGGTDDVAAAYVPAGTQSYEAPTLPVGRTLYARVWTEINGAWSIHHDISFTTSGGAAFMSPADGQANAAPGPLTWTSVAGAQSYGMWIGTTPGGLDLAATMVPAGTTSYDTALPVGKTVYARIWTIVGGAWTRYHDISFIPGGGARFTAPGDGQTGVDPTQPLSWSPVSGGQYYWVSVGTTAGAADVAYGGFGSGTTSFAPASLPSARKLYARVWTMVAGVWERYQDISFTTA